MKLFVCTFFLEKTYPALDAYDIVKGKERDRETAKERKTEGYSYVLTSLQTTDLAVNHGYQKPYVGQCIKCLYCGPSVCSQSNLGRLQGEM